MIGVGMRQFDLVSATATASSDAGPRLSAAQAGSGLLAAGMPAPETEALAALFPEFTIRRSLRDFPATEVSGVASWSDLRGKGSRKSRAAALRIPFLQFGP